MAEGITSIEELKKAQAAAQQAGTSITNYEEWANILEDLDIAGVQSTGTYAGDVKLHSQNNDFNKTDYKTSQDKEQTVKANVVNATSSMIMADYMKYYHLLQ